MKRICYFIEDCRVCQGQYVIQKCKATNKLYVICDECGHAYNTPGDCLNKKNFIPWGTRLGYCIPATKKEIKAAEWWEYVKDCYINDIKPQPKPQKLSKIDYKSIDLDELLKPE